MLSIPAKILGTLAKLLGTLCTVKHHHEKQMKRKKQIFELKSSLPLTRKFVEIRFNSHTLTQGTSSKMLLASKMVKCDPIIIIWITETPCIKSGFDFNRKQAPKNIVSRFLFQQLSSEDHIFFRNLGSRLKKEKHFVLLRIKSNRVYL
jgi:hypothetical protein